MNQAAVFAAVFAAYSAAHWLGDYWIQTSHQGTRKADPGRAGRRACVRHVITYTMTLAALLTLAAWWLALPLSTGWMCAGLGVSAVTHYIADRKYALRWLAARIGKAGFWDYGDGLASGAKFLDQAWHWGWLFIAALITTGGPHG